MGRKKRGRKSRGRKNRERKNRAKREKSSNSSSQNRPGSQNSEATSKATESSGGRLNGLKKGNFNSLTVIVFVVDFGVHVVFGGIIFIDTSSSIRLGYILYVVVVATCCGRSDFFKTSSAGSPIDGKEVKCCRTLSCLFVTISFVVVAVTLGIALIYVRTNPIVAHHPSLIKSTNEIPPMTASQILLSNKFLIKGPNVEFVFIDDCQQVSVVPSVSSGNISYHQLLKITGSKIPKYIKFNSSNCMTQTLPHFALNDTCLEIFVLPKITLPDCWKLREIPRYATFDSTNSHRVSKSWVTENVNHFALNDRCQEISVLPGMILKDIYCWKLRTAAGNQSGNAPSSNNQAPSSNQEEGNYQTGDIHNQNLLNNEEVVWNRKAETEEKLRDTNESQPELYCKNSQGQNVDWYYVIKLPKMPKSNTNRIKEGTGFYYLDDQNMDFQLSQTEVNQTVSNPIANTLNQIYDPAVQCLIYNDRFPDASYTKGTEGHAKGVVAYRPNSGGFWMIHSIPGFPKSDGYLWPDSAKKHGQNAFCVSLPLEEMIKIEHQLQIIQPHVFFKRGVWEYSRLNTQKTSRAKTVFYSRNREKFTHLAKAPVWNKEFYSMYVAPKLKSELYTRTWIQGKRPTSEGESKFPVTDIKEIQFGDMDKIPNTKDHSKWAISGPSQTKKKSSVLVI